MLRGIDVSHHQGTVNWAELKAVYGLSWGAAKATEGTTFFDSSFGDNWAKMKAAGLVRMAYHFAHPDNDASRSANAFLAYVNKYGMDSSDIMVMDMEGNSNNLPMLAVNDWLCNWAGIVAAETGRKPFIYVGGGYVTNNATRDIAANYAGWWYPRYPSAYDGNTMWPASIGGYPTPNNWGKAPDIWQFSQSFANAWDANIADMTLADLKTRGIVGGTEVITDDDIKRIATAIGPVVYAQNSQYAKDFWVASTGTGTGIRGDIKAILAAVSNPAALAAAIVAKMPPATVSDANLPAYTNAVEAALREVFADAATPDVPPVNPPVA